MRLNRQVQALGLLALLERQVLQVRWVRLVLRELPGRWEVRVPLASLVRQDLPVQLAPQVLRAQRVLSDPLAPQAPRVQPELQVRSVRQV